MCKSASMIITKSATFYDTTMDQHELIIKANYLTDGEFVRVEIVPPGNDYSLPLDQWKFRVDQDILPEWWDKTWGEGEARRMLPEWAAHHIKRDCIIDIVEPDQTIFMYNCTITTMKGGEYCERRMMEERAIEQRTPWVTACRVRGPRPLPDNGWAGRS